MHNTYSTNWSIIPVYIFLFSLQPLDYKVHNTTSQTTNYISKWHTSNIISVTKGIVIPWDMTHLNLVHSPPISWESYTIHPSSPAYEQNLYDLIYITIIFFFLGLLQLWKYTPRRSRVRWLFWGKKVLYDTALSSIMTMIQPHLRQLLYSVTTRWQGLLTPSDIYIIIIMQPLDPLYRALSLSLSLSREISRWKRTT